MAFVPGRCPGSPLAKSADPLFSCGGAISPGRFPAKGTAIAAEKKREGRESRKNLWQRKFTGPETENDIGENSLLGHDVIAPRVMTFLSSPVFRSCHATWKNFPPMKIKTKAAFLAVLAVLEVSVALAEPPAKDLLAQAKITQAEAEKTALASVPEGKTKAAELEREHGKLVWSFDIVRPKTKNITEVQVDAKTGKIAATEIETPADQAREAAEDAAKK